MCFQDLRQGHSMTDAQVRESQEKFLLNTALRTITRSFGAALLNYQSRQAEAMETAILAKINLKGRINPTNMNLEYPDRETQLPQVKAAFKQMSEWSHFFNGVARGLSTILGPQAHDRRYFDPADEEEEQLEQEPDDAEAAVDHHFHLYGRRKTSLIDADAEVSLFMTTYLVL